MKTNTMILALLSSLTFVTAGARSASAQESAAPQRGTVVVQGASAKAVVAGPVAIHAYSEFSGATLFVVNAVTGTDRDCAAGAAAHAAVTADHVQTFFVGAGQVACVSSTSARGTELLWHAQKTVAAPAMVLARR
jgi:hypothetical protein